MGIPYSREINTAFEQVAPLVAAGFEVLQTTKNISILLAAIQVLTVLTLVAVLFVLIAILYSVNPDLEDERRELVTPLFKKIARVSMGGILKAGAYVYAVFFCFFILAMAGYVVWEKENARIGRVARGEDGEGDVVDEQAEKEEEEANSKSKSKSKK